MVGMACQWSGVADDGVDVLAVEDLSEVAGDEPGFCFTVEASRISSWSRDLASSVARATLDTRHLHEVAQVGAHAPATDERHRIRSFAPATWSEDARGPICRPRRAAPGRR
jgi:hypothetical protein